MCHPVIQSLTKYLINRQKLSALYPRSNSMSLSLCLKEKEGRFSKIASCWCPYLRWVRSLTRPSAPCHTIFTAMALVSILRLWHPKGENQSASIHHVRAEATPCSLWQRVNVIFTGHGRVSAYHLPPKPLIFFDFFSGGRLILLLWVDIFSESRLGFDENSGNTPKPLSISSTSVWVHRKCVFFCVCFFSSLRPLALVSPLFTAL